MNNTTTSDPKPPMQRTIDLNLVNALKLFVSKDDTRFALTGVHFTRSDDGHPVAVATDGRKLAVIEQFEVSPDELPKFRQRVESAAEHFSRGIYALSSLGPLRLLNVSLCTKVNGYGDFVECDAYALVPGKPVILYVEVENFTAERVQADPAQAGWGRSSSRRTSSSNSPRYVTELHGRYEILDVNQRTVVSRTLPVGGDECRNQRRDFYISYVLYMPENIAPGTYTLELTIEDKKGGKFGNAVVDFRIR